MDYNHDCNDKVVKQERHDDVDTDASENDDASCGWDPSNTYDWEGVTEGGNFSDIDEDPKDLAPRDSWNIVDGLIKEGFEKIGNIDRMDSFFLGEF